MTADHKARGGVSEAERIELPGGYAMAPYHSNLARCTLYRLVKPDGESVSAFVEAEARAFAAALEAAAQVRADQPEPRSGRMAWHLEQAGAEVKRLAAENDVLRASMANGSGPCAYCTLPRSRWAECEHGFPGCPRGDDAMLCPHVGAELETADKLAAAEARAARAVEVLRKVQRNGAGFCRVCDGWRNHTPTCELAALLSDHPAPEPGVEARNAALEEAAKVADTYEGRLRCSSAWNETMTAQEGYDAGVADASIYIAKGVRALQSPAKGGRDGK